jgi:hypothetical protein
VLDVLSPRRVRLRILRSTALRSEYGYCRKSATSGRRRGLPRSGHSRGYATHRNWPHHLSQARRPQHRGLHCHRSCGRSQIALRPVGSVDRVEPTITDVDLQPIAVMLLLVRRTWPARWGHDDWLARMNENSRRVPAAEKTKGPAKRFDKSIDSGSGFRASAGFPASPRRSHHAQPSDLLLLRGSGREKTLRLPSMPGPHRQAFRARPRRLYAAVFIGAVDPIHDSPIGVREHGRIDNV